MADSPFTKIAVMQLFYELKQKFPAIPDRVVSEYLEQSSYDKEICENYLSQEYKNHLLQSYPSDIVDKMSEGKIKCRPRSLCLANQDTSSEEFFKRHGFGRQSLDSRIDKVPRGCDPPELSSPQQRNVLPERLKTSNRCLSANDVRKASSSLGYSSASVPLDLNIDNSSSNRVEEIRESIKDIEIRSNEDVFVSDLRLHFRNDNCGCERTKVRVQCKKAFGQSHSDPSTPSEHQQQLPPSGNSKKRTSLNVDNVAFPVSKSCEPKRPFTSVNLTLRPPSNNPQPPINVYTNGSKLTYSTCSYDPKLGYQNELQISISEEGNTTLSASRVKTSPGIPETSCDLASESCDSLSFLKEPLPPVTRLRLQEQLECKQKLEKELEKDKKKLEAMQKEVTAMERDLERRRRVPVISQKVIQLRNEVRALQLKCDEMINKVDGSTENPIPLGETSKEFYKNVKVTQRDNEDTSSQHTTVPLLPVENGNWTCHMCTFRNHPMLPKCEQCEMARVDMSNALANILRPPTATTHRSAVHPSV